MSELVEFMDFSVQKIAKHLVVARAKNKQANEFFKEHHYLHRTRHSKKLCYSVSIKGVLVGFIEFSYPIWHRRKGVIPPFKQGEVVELSRLCLHDNAPKNSESCAISKALKLVAPDWKALTGIEPKLVVSYADLKGQGHSGGIYKAVGFDVIGVSHRFMRPRHRSPHHPKPYSTNGGKLLFGLRLK